MAPHGSDHLDAQRIHPGATWLSGIARGRDRQAEPNPQRHSRGAGIARDAFPYWQQAQHDLGDLVGAESLSELVKGANGLVERLGPQQA
jgi:hypothetical protein